MASGQITGNFTGGTDSSNFKYRLVWSSTPDPANLRSKVVLSWYVISVNYAVTTYKQNAAWSKTIDGTSTSGTANFNYPNPASIPKNTPKLFRSESVYISHDPDGTKSVSISGTINLSGTSAGTGSLSGTMVLDVIPVNPPVATGLTLSDTGGAYGLVGAYVSGFTILSLTATATEGDGIISSYAFYRDGSLMGTVTTSALTATLNMTELEPSGAHIYSVTVTDSYGLSATYSLASVTIEPYTMPTITATTFRCDSLGNANNEGTYGKVDMSWTVANVGSNAATVHKVTINGSDYTSFPQIVSGIATTNTYSAVYLVTDTLGSSSTITQQIQVSFINFDLYPSSSGGGVAFGEASQNDKFIVNHSESIFRGDADITGDLTIGNPLAIAEGGTGMSSLATSTTVASTSGATIEEQYWCKWGKVAMGMIRISGTIAAGGTVNGTLSSDWRPKSRATGCGYYSQSPFIIQIVDDDTFTIRNASGNSRSPSSSSPLTVAVTYILA